MADTADRSISRRSMGKLPLAIAAAALAAPQIARAQTAAAPSITASDSARAVEFVRRLLKQGAPNLRAGDRVVLTADGSFDPKAIDLLRQILWESQLKFDVIQLQGVGKETDAAKLQIDLWCLDPRVIWPAWVWNALEDSAAVLSAYGPDVHNMTSIDANWFTERKIARLRFWHATLGTVLVDALEQGIGYPEEILSTSQAVSRKNFANARRIRVTDPNGTDFSFSAKRSGMVYSDAKGKVVAYAMHGGLIPKTTMHLEAGRVVKVEGEGDLAKQMRWILANMGKYTFPTAPAPGGAFLVECDLDRTHPKIVRPAWQGMYGAAKYFAFSKGYKRGGVLTVGFGTPTARSPGVMDFARANNLTLQHLDTHLYHATVTVDGREVIKTGRPIALDDPSVRAVAAKYGDPNELLRFDWVPELNGT